MTRHQEGRYIRPRRGLPRKNLAVWMGAVAVAILVAAVAFVLLRGRTEADYSTAERACISERHRQFDPKIREQCLDVCKSCIKGNTGTCTTSCKLKGAS